jgi:hypothetical protein
MKLPEHLKHLAHLDNEVIIKTEYCEAADQDVHYTALSWARELELRLEIRAAQQEYIDSLE